MEQSGRAVVFADLTGSTHLFESIGNLVATRIITQCTQALGTHFSRSGGRVVKYLGDGVLVLFEDIIAAVEACARAQDMLNDLAIKEIRNFRIGVKIGAEYGEIVEQNGDCYGDAVNVASRLSDLAQPKEILIGETLYQHLPRPQRMVCHSLDRIAIRGKAEPVPVWRLDWVRNAESTHMIPFELFDLQEQFVSSQRIELNRQDQHHELTPSDGPLVIGRGESNGFIINDPRVSRRHARIEWIAGQCELTDFSSNGTWVRFNDNPAAPISLRRDTCTLYGKGEIGFGTTPTDFTAPTISFHVINNSD